MTDIKVKDGEKMFIVGGVIGVVVVGAAAHGDYSDHSNHSNYSKYGDAELVREIDNMQRKVNQKETDIENFRTQIQNKFNSQINELRREKNYSAFNHASTDINLIQSVKQDMKNELAENIRQEKNQLAEIDRMIARINEIELQQRK